jgi:hypothetical protein
MERRIAKYDEDRAKREAKYARRNSLGVKRLRQRYAAQACSH